MAKRATKAAAKKDNQNGNATPPADHNETAAADDDRRLLAIQFRDSLDGAKRAVAAARDQVNHIKANIRAQKFSVKQIEQMILLTTPEGEKKVREEAQHAIDALRWSGASVGTQFDLLDPTEDRRPAVERAYDEGKVAGMEGKPRRPPYDVSVPQHHEWQRGWHDGQVALARKGFREAPLDQIAKDGAMLTEGEGEQDLRPPHLIQREQDRVAAADDEL